MDDKEKKKTSKKLNAHEEKIIELETKNKELHDKYLRLQAEFANFSARCEIEKANYLKYDGEKIIKELLPVCDNFERAIKMDNKDMSDEVSKFLDGFKLIYSGILNLFEKIGVREIQCLGLNFDPNYEEAVMVEEDQTKPSNVVLEVYTKGYLYKDKLIRPAMVKVNK